MADDRPRKPLRRGWTTGTCATAATAAAYQALITGQFPQTVTVLLPRGGEAELSLDRGELADGTATAAFVKDAGDDPDVTHGALVMVTVARAAQGSGVTLIAGEGVGIVTLPGLPVAVGEPAINPGPRGMIERAIRQIAEQYGESGDVLVTVSIPGGEALAEKTLNARLGIKGGLSILGTTGVVVPFSCSAWLLSIHRGIDVARAAGIDHLAAATGSTSEQAVRRMYGLADTALIDMGDFVGGTLKYLRTHPVARLTLAGGFAKMVKLAQGDLFLHSSRSQVNMKKLTETLQSLGAPPSTVGEAGEASSAAQVLALARAAGVPLAESVAVKAYEVASQFASASMRIEVVVFDRSGRLVGRAPDHD